MIAFPSGDGSLRAGATKRALKRFFMGGVGRGGQAKDHFNEISDFYGFALVFSGVAPRNGADQQ